MSEGSYGQRMLNRLMKKTVQGEQLESLKREYTELGEENDQLKERIEELETKVRNHRSALCHVTH
jgi:cell division septum initiation protein DivIVA